MSINYYLDFFFKIIKIINKKNILLIMEIDVFFHNMHK